MNKFQRAGLAVVVASGMAFAKGELWGPNTLDFPSLQVNVPDAVECWNDNPERIDGNPCYEGTAGWWYGYDYAGGKVDVQIEGAYVPFGDGTSLAAEADGASKIDTDGFHIKFTAVSDGSKDAQGAVNYGGAGFGFDFGAPKSKTQDINAKNGYCITYSSDAAVLFKLGHDETVYSDACTFEASLQASNGEPKVVKLAWSDFKLPEWCSGAGKPASVVTKNIALGQAVGIKIGTEATNSTTAKTIYFILHQFGWYDDGCNTDNSSPIIPAGAIASNVKFSMAGRAVSMFVEKSSAVQIINLHGSVVYSKTLPSASETTMSLSNLPAGIYMLHVPSLNYTKRIILK